MASSASSWARRWRDAASRRTSTRARSRRAHTWRRSARPGWPPSAALLEGLQELVERGAQSLELVGSGGDQRNAAVALVSQPREVPVSFRAAVRPEEQQAGRGERDLQRLRFAGDLLRAPEDQRAVSHLAAATVVLLEECAQVRGQAGDGIQRLLRGALGRELHAGKVHGSLIACGG